MKKYVTRFTAISFLIFILSVLIYISAVNFSQIADFINNTVSAFVRIILSSLTYFIPFSFFEMLIIIAPIALFLLAFLLVKRRVSREERIRSIVSFFAIIALVFTSYIYTLGVGYRTSTLSQRIGIEDKKDISVSDLNYTISILVDELNALAELVPFDGETTVMPYSADNMSERLVHAYDLMNEEYGLVVNYKSKVKPVYFSTVMSDLGITGIYSFFTGEANVNVEYPDYCVPFTAAHEMAHQRGISRENEANFVAFLVCIASDDDYVRYCGYLNMYEYIASALYSADPDAYYEVLARVHPYAIEDMRAAISVYTEHKDSVLGEINDRLNDAYLKANGTEGVVSYGYVVRLAVGYYLGRAELQ